MNAPLPADQISTGAGQGADAATAATEPVRRPGSLPSNEHCIRCGEPHGGDQCPYSRTSKNSVSIDSLRGHAMAWSVTADTPDDEVFNESHMARECARAADEIERLQRERDDWKNAAQELDRQRAAGWPVHEPAAPTSEARILLDRAVDVMAALHRAFEPMEDVEGVPAMVNPAAVRSFVDALADIDYQRYRLRDDVPPPATHTQWQRDRLATYLAKHRPALPDHACAQCVPDGEIVVEDFECCYHMALRIVGTSETKDATPPDESLDERVQARE